LSTAGIQTRLKEEHAALQDFIALLEREQQILLAPNTEPLLDLAAEKTRAAEALTARVQQRPQYIPAEPGQTESWLRQHAPAALDVWLAIRRLGAQAHALNQSNGELIKVRTRYNQQALQALLGATQQSAGLYGPQGKTSLPGSGRTLGSG